MTLSLRSNGASTIMRTTEFAVHELFPATPEERRILVRWGSVFQALQEGTREPQTEIQRLFVEEVSGRIYVVSVSAQLWLRYRGWLKEMEKRAAEQRDWIEKERQGYLKRVQDDAAYLRWLKEHQFDDFR